MLLNVKTVKSVVTKVLALGSAILFARLFLLLLTIVFTSIVNIPECSPLGTEKLLHAGQYIMVIINYYECR